MNILDLNSDILNIIGDYVKKDNAHRIKKEKANAHRIKKEEDFQQTDEILKYLKLKNKFVKVEIGEAIYSQLFKNCYTNEEINEYIKSRKLPLKKWR